MLKKLAVLMFFVTFIQGCQTTNYAESIGEYKTNKQVSGLVLLSTTANTGEIPQIYSVTVKHINGNKSKEHIFRNEIGGKSKSTSLFFGGLPAGEYKVTKVTALVAMGTKSLNVENSPLLGNFIVKSGKTSDLGRLILTAVNDKVALGRSEIITNNTALVSRFFEHEHELMSNNTFFGWAVPHKEEDTIESFALAHPQGIASMSELENGQIIAGTRLGHTLIRSNNGEWRVLARNSGLNQIVATAPYEIKGSLAVVADDFGSLYKLSEEGDSHNLDKGNLPNGNVVFISPSKEYRHWFIAIERDGFSELYKSEKINDGLWELESRVEVGFDAWSGNQFAFYWRRPSGIGFSASKNNLISCYDFDSNRWIKNSTPEKRSVISVSATEANNFIGVLTSPGGGFGGVFAKTHFTDDCGESWSETDSPYSVKASAPLVIKDGFILETGGVFSDEGVYASKDFGKSWYKISNEMVLSNRLWLTKNHGLFSVSNGTYGFENIENSKDYGATWNLELTSFNFSINK